MQQRLAVPFLVDVALQLEASDVRQGVPLHARRSFEGKLEFVEQITLQLAKISLVHPLPGRRGTADRAFAVRARDTERAANARAADQAASRAAEARDRGRRGGQARKGDELTKAIRALSEPGVKHTQRQVLHRLRKLVGLGTFVSVTRDAITWLDVKGNSHTVRGTALKDRIYRVRKYEGATRGGKVGRRPRLNAVSLRWLNSVSRKAA